MVSSKLSHLVLSSAILLLTHCKKSSSRHSESPDKTEHSEPDNIVKITPDLKPDLKPDPDEGIIASPLSVTKTAHAFDLNLPGLPVVKTIFPDVSTAVLLVEELQMDTVHSYYVHDHKRKLFLKRSDDSLIQEILIDPKIPGEGFHISDVEAIATQKIVVSYSSYDERARKIHHGFALVDLKDNRLDVSYQKVEKSESFGSEQGAEFGSPATVDLSSLAVRENQIALSGLNSNGMFFVELYTLKNGKAEFLANQPVELGYEDHIGMTGGTYDVMGQLIHWYKIHSLFREDGSLVVAFDYYRPHSALVTRFPNGAAGLAKNVKKDDPAMHAIVFTYSLNLAALVNVQWFYLGLEGILQSLSTHKNDVLLTGLTRDPEKGLESHSRLMINDNVDLVVDLNASASTTASLYVAGLGWVFAGSSGWTQNPSGLSISGGRAYLGILSEDNKDIKSSDEFFKDLVHGQRSEVRSLSAYNSEVVCASGMTNGPDTHYADRDNSLLRGDGFLRCFKSDDMKSLAK